ncbi:hypothetical protein [Robiginitalea aurantiaca]|uniref:DUF983 domain-containing protein n=1 Tax=Robiginitalea aurantiaca TaxID=3056915 RepID=A0ABT7WFV9_9FLAO|nr:hypothetical protein [Robiginitalea aurantiaca]MDM9631807.1 hypothetical protein [Robiginitalea aurantiaca]
MKKDQKQITKRRFTLESVGIILLLITPFVFKAHEYFPETEEPVSFLWFEIGANGFGEVSTHVWFLLGKIIPLYLLTFWFFTCKHWWYHIILIPLCMYAFQIFEVMYSLDNAIDTKNVLWILPVCMIVIPFVYFIRLKLFDKYVHGIDMEAMAAELDYYKNKEKAELDRAGVKVNSFTAENVQEDLSNKAPTRTLNEIMKQMQTAMKSLLSL